MVLLFLLSVFVLGSLQSDKIIEIKTIIIMAGCSNFFVYLKITISKLVGFSTGGVSSCRKFSPGSNHPATPNFLSSPLRPKSQLAYARRSERQAGSFLLTDNHHKTLQHQILATLILPKDESSSDQDSQT
jgi:hypothetical protein